MTRMPWLELRLAAAKLAAEQRMRLEHEQAEREARALRALARRRVTVRPSRWSSSERELWRRDLALQASLRALAREQSTVRHVGRAIDCPACLLAIRSQIDERPAGDEPTGRRQRVEEPMSKSPARKTDDRDRQ